jgi:2-iminobutanoate/2-iminopropanoate deaminase
MKKVYGSSELLNAPLSSAWEANGVVFISGQIPADKEWKLIGETIEERFTAAMGNVKNILATADLTVNDIIQVRLYLTDLAELPALNEAYKKYFNHPFPARTALGVSKLPLGASLEIEVVAARQ